MSESSEPEHWLPIPGAEGFYEASTHGRIRSVDRTIICRNGARKHLRGKALTPYVDEQGRLRVTLFTPRKSFDVRLVSQLVLETFVSPRPDGTEGCHNDGDPSNNRPENLRWDTHEENMQDAIRHGRNAYLNREQCPRNHMLIKPNLVASKESQGHRNCLACDRAKAAVGIKNWNNSDQPCPYGFDELADAYYAKIMSLPVPTGVQLPIPRKERTQCNRNHKLIEPNLVPSGLRKNKRICLACQRAFSAQSNAKAKWTDDYFKQIADGYYKDIMRYTG